MYNDHCCKGCDKRQVGCRSDCEAWAQHEAEKAKYYSERSIMNNAHYVSRSLQKTLSEQARRVHGYAHRK